MNKHSLLGPAAPDDGWVPAPRYLLRRHRIIRALADIQPCEALEIGCGPAMLLQELAAKGFSASALETSDVARAMAQSLAEKAKCHINFYETVEPTWIDQFSLILAFEVLEHISDDVEALQHWSRWLAPGGVILISVPAHQRRWNARDVWAGHVRRYERDQLTDVAKQAGLIVDHIECYGFPLANVLETLGARRYSQHARVLTEPTEQTRDENTAQSGIDRSADAKWFPFLRSLPGRLALRVAIEAQRPFLTTEFGNGYLMRAHKA